MGTFSDTPALTASATIAPWRFVKISGVNQGAAATATTDIVIGATDGSTLSFDSTNHATSGDPITLQGGDVLLIQASATITAGDRVGPTTGGKAVTISTKANQVCNFVALETAGAAEQVIRILRVNANTSS
jgi:hypothetical protein